MVSVRSREKLGSKVLNKLSPLIGTIYFVILITWIVSKIIGESEINNWLIDCVMGMLLVCFVCRFVRLLVARRKRKRTNDFIHKNLSWDEYKQINVKSPDGKYLSDMIWYNIQILKLELYAKLNIDQTIFIVARNKDGKELYNFSIDVEDYNLFISHFEF